jgi:hypothetical protein
MESILNLLWLLLMLPAYWVWRHRKPVPQAARPHYSWRDLLLLSCILMLLFPVVSATDDLHAMRRDMEESSSGKWTESGGKSHRGRPDSADQTLAQGSPAVLSPAADHVCGLVLIDINCLTETVWLAIRAGRAPPYSCLG